MVTEGVVPKSHFAFVFFFVIISQTNFFIYNKLEQHRYVIRFCFVFNYSVCFNLILLLFYFALVFVFFSRSRED